MRNCPNCNNGVDETATKCPHCGAILNFQIATKSNNKTEKIESSQKNPFQIWFFAILIIGLIIVLNSFMKPKTSQQAQMNNATSLNATSTPTLAGMDGINFGFTTIPENITAYLKTSTKYNSYYNATKKFGIYFTGAGCPYAQAFDNAMNPIINDYNYQQYYNFMAIDIAQGVQRFANMEEAQNDVNFNNMCKEFCIVNPNKAQIFYIDGVGEAEAAKLGYIFETLKTW